MSALSDYKASVENRGGYYFRSLPPNAVSRTDAGKVGGRFPEYSASRAYHYEVAPIAVQLEAGTTGFLSGMVDAVTTYAAENPLGIPTWADDLEGVSLDGIKKAYEKGKALGPKAPSLLDVIAYALGIPKALLIVVLLLVGYAMLRQAGLVPTLKKVVG